MIQQLGRWDGKTCIVYDFRHVDKPTLELDTEGRRRAEKHIGYAGFNDLVTQDKDWQEFFAMQH